MAILKDSDLFDFDRYRQQLAETGVAALELARASEASAARIKSAYDGTIGQLGQIQQAINSVSTAQAEKAAKIFKEYDDQIDQLGKEVERYRGLLKTLNDAQSASGFSITEMTRLLSGLEREYKTLQPTQADFATKQKDIADKVRAVSTVLNAQNQVLREAKRATDAAEGSYAKLTTETNDLRAALRAMPNAFDTTTGAINRHNAAALEMQRIIERNDRVLKTADASMGQHQRKVGDYGSALSGLSGQALQAAGAIIGISSAFDAISAGLRVISDMERIDSSLKAVSKDSADFRNTQQFLIGTADRLGLQYESLARSYKGLKAATNQTALEGKATQQIFTGLTNAGAALKLSNEEVEGALLAVTQMVSKQKVSMEELSQQLGERLPGALRILAEGMGISTGKMTKMVSTGQLLAVDVLPQLASQLDKVYGKDAANNAETMAGGWNRLVNQVHLFLAAMNDNQAISKTATNFTNMIADTLKGIRVAIQSDDWKTFFGSMLIGPANIGGIGTSSRQQVANNARNQTVVDEFRTMTPKQRDARIGITQDNISRNQKRLDTDFSNTIAGGDKSKVENTLKADRDLLTLLKREDLKQKVKDRADADQAEINATRKANDKKEADADRLAKEAKAKETARRKAETEADRKLNDSLSNAKAGTDLQIAGLSADKQDGLISERDFIEQRQKLTLAGIDERQSLLEKAGKKETDDYKRLSKDKIEAETAYKRDSLKLALSDSKNATSGKLSALSSDKAEGTVSPADYVEKKKQITIEGIQQQQQILADAGQQESKLYKDLDIEALNIEKEYYKERAKIKADEWKKELNETKEQLKQYDQEIGADYAEQLSKLERFYVDKERAIRLNVKKGEITPGEGDAQVHALKLEHLTEELKATEDAYAKDRTLSDSLVNDRIAALKRYQDEAIRTPKEIANAEEAIRQLEKQRDQDTADDKIKLDKAVADNANKKSDENYEHEGKNIDKLKEKKKVLYDQAFSLASSIGDATFSIASSNNQRDSDALDKQHEKELQLAGDNADARTRIDEQYAKRKAELARKQAITDRESALFSVALSTAQGVAAVLSTGGGTHYADFGISAGILSAFVIAAGIAQSAAILSKPLPAYKYGKLETDNYSGPALAGEAGAELFVDRNGYSQLLTKPTIIDTKFGDRIYNANETADILSEVNSFGSTADRLREGQFREKAAIYKVALEGNNSNLSEAALERAFGKALDARPSNETHIDYDGLKRGQRRANSYTEYLEKRSRL